MKAFQKLHMLSLSEAYLALTAVRVSAWTVLRVLRKSSLAAGAQSAKAVAVGSGDQSGQAIVSR